MRALTAGAFGALRMMVVGSELVGSGLGIAMAIVLMPVVQLYVE